MDSKVKIDQRLAEAVRIALRDFGDGILKEDRLMGVLKDYQGFRDFQQGEFMVRTIITDGTLSRLLAYCKNKPGRHQEHLNRETQRIARQYGFSYSLIQTLLRSFLKGMGVEDDSNSAKVIPINLGNNPIGIPTADSTSNGSIAAPSSKSSGNRKDQGKNAFLKCVMVSFILLLLGILAVFFVQEYTKDEPVSGSSVSEMEIISDTLLFTDPYILLITETKQETPPPADDMHESDIKPEEKPAEKKKPIDPRFQYPDGRYKQPSEYMEYFNEDEDDDYEDGYEDGYDDALDDY